MSIQPRNKVFGDIISEAALTFPGGSAGKEATCNVGDLCFMPGLGRSSGEGNDYPSQYSGLENSIDYSMGSQRVEHDSNLAHYIITLLTF